MSSAIRILENFAERPFWSIAMLALCRIAPYRLRLVRIDGTLPLSFPGVK